MEVRNIAAGQRELEQQRDDRKESEKKKRNFRLEIINLFEFDLFPT